MLMLILIYMYIRIKTYYAILTNLKVKGGGEGGA